MCYVPEGGGIHPEYAHMGVKAHSYQFVASRPTGTAEKRNEGYDFQDNSNIKEKKLEMVRHPNLLPPPKKPPASHLDLHHSDSRKFVPGTGTGV